MERTRALSRYPGVRQPEGRSAQPLALGFSGSDKRCEARGPRFDAEPALSVPVPVPVSVPVPVFVTSSPCARVGIALAFVAWGLGQPTSATLGADLPGARPDRSGRGRRVASELGPAEMCLMDPEQPPLARQAVDRVGHPQHRLLIIFTCALASTMSAPRNRRHEARASTRLPIPTIDVPDL
jgi:hypothetical protein